MSTALTLYATKADMAVYSQVFKLSKIQEFITSSKKIVSSILPKCESFSRHIFQTFSQGTPGLTGKELSVIAQPDDTVHKVIVVTALCGIFCGLIGAAFAQCNEAPESSELEEEIEVEPIKLTFEELAKLYEITKYLDSHPNVKQELKNILNRDDGSDNIENDNGCNGG